MASSPSDLTDELCLPFLRALPIDGVSICVVGAGRAGSTVCASDDTAARIDEVQFSLGEGPRWEVFRTGEAAIIPDFPADDHSRWPMFGAHVSMLSVGALFAFPLVFGAAVVGVVDMFRQAVGGFDPVQSGTAQFLANEAAPHAVRRATMSAQREWTMPAGIAPEMRREVQQAAGMILVQLDTTASEALIRLRAHAFASNQTILQVAKMVITRRLDFRDVPD